MADGFGRFQVVRKLASGGMGEIFLARAPGASKPLVLKRILPHLAQNKEFLDLFLDEARIAARLVHPNVAQIFELGDVDGAWYLAMEYVAGKDLREAIELAARAKTVLPLGLACRICAGVAAGLHAAHRATDAQGRPLAIVHRDVSPHNVLLGYDGAVKLIDFGVARAAGRLPANSEEAGLQGKYPYLSPEQVNDGEVTHLSDQFSLGVVLWELLSGERLFKASSDAVTIQRVAEAVVPPPARAEPLPPELVAICLRALEKEPLKRFPDTGALGEALQAWEASASELGAWLERLAPPAKLPGEPQPPAESGATPAEIPSLPVPWSTLPDHEQLALAQLSVLPARFSLEAAEAIISLAAFPKAPWALDVLESLRSRSLVSSWPRADALGELEFGLPSHVRTEAAEKLKGWGSEEASARTRHAAAKVPG